MKEKNNTSLWTGIILSGIILLILSVSLDSCKSVKENVSSSQERTEDLFTEGFPRAFFFRSSEGTAGVGYEEWNSTFTRQGGIIGKSLDEEIPGRSGNIPYFTRFKKEHPEQLVLIHYNGNARDPEDNGHMFHAGHWLYFGGSIIMDDLPANEGLAVIRVEDASIFMMNMGLLTYSKKSSNEDIGICRLTEDGKSDWNYAEQVRLVDRDTLNNTITVRRAQYGTQALEFKKGKAIAAAHLSEGPWSTDNHLLWMYNHTTLCPRDANGMTCDDILVREFGTLFGKGGKLEYFDGIEFDVLYNDIGQETFGRSADLDCDGKGDHGIFDGINTYSKGVFNFIRDLREKVGPDKLIMSDGHRARCQRCMPYLNGIESEGWPLHTDPELKDWSGGWNRHLFWNQHSFKPRFSYVNFRSSAPVEQQRLVWAAAQMFDARFASSGYRISKPVDGIYMNIIDEMVAGERKEKYWLGHPGGPAVRLALKQPDVIKGAGRSINNSFLSGWEGDGISFEKDGKSLKVSSVVPGNMHFYFKGVPCSGPDLLVSLRLRCEAHKAYPEEMPRVLNVFSSSNPYKLMSFVNGEWFDATFYFRDINEKTIDLSFEIESNEPLWISDFTAHAYPDAVYRIFENGLVLGNPSHHDFTFDLEAIARGKKYRRLTATAGQDTIVNNGQPAGKTVTLGIREGLFLEH